MKNKKFKAKKKKMKKFLKFIFLFFFFFSYIFMIFFLKKNKLKENILKKDINIINFNLIDNINKSINYNINNPVNLLNNKVKKVNKVLSVNSEIKNTNNEKTKIFEPTIYLYNTHQNEKYIDYDVILAANYLKDNLNNKNIDTLLEEKSISAFLDKNNFKYYKSYVASKTYIKEAKEKYSSLEYYFDIHRDSVNKNKSTITYNNKSYAKILFIIGLENNNYEANFNNANILNNILNNKINGISRGIYKKEGKGVDGVYNQDMSSNLFLIEVGGLENTKEEVINTLDILSESIYEYIKGDI